MEKSHQQGAIVSILTGTLSQLYGLSFTFWDGYQNLNPFLKELTYPASILSVLALIVVSIATPKLKKENLEPFFRSKFKIMFGLVYAVILECLFSALLILCFVNIVISL